VTDRLSNKIALITGAASGIGRAAAERFVAEGATVILADRAADRLAKTLGALRAEGTEHRSIQFDVTDQAGWIRAAAEIDAAFGRLDVLVNNAGYGHFRSIEDTTLEEWHAILAVNLDSVFLGTKHMLPLLARSGRGSIINVSSIRGMVAGPNTASYAASKGGVRMLTKSTALECASAGNGVRANSIHPGQVRTPLSAQALNDPAMKRATVDRIPMGRMGEAVEIATAIVFLASDESSFMTGSEMTIDGGYTAQ
jgi:meso-butanediol dehydrogenase / (S,S)-butanediol dehydrogenase / diacetyl reductase